MKTWGEVDRLYGQYSLTVRGFDAARKEAREIKAAVSARINREREADRLRLEELEEIAKGSGAAARMAALEREEMSGKRYFPTNAEKAAYEETEANAREAIAELRDVQSQFAEACKAACAELDTLRKAVIGDQLDPALRLSWIEGERREFEALGHE